MNKRFGFEVALVTAWMSRKSGQVFRARRTLLTKSDEWMPVSRYTLLQNGGPVGGLHITREAAEKALAEVVAYYAAAEDEAADLEKTGAW